MKTRLLCFLMVLALLPCLALAEDAPQKLVVAEPVHLIGYLPLYVAIHEGYFADEGLDVTVVQATGGAHVTAVVSGDAFAVIGVKRSTMEQQPETCLRFVRAMMKALKAVQDDHELAARVLELEFPTLTEAGRQAALERAYADNLWSADGIISRQAVDTLMEVVISSGIFDGTYDVDELIDMRFVEQVMQESAQE